MEQIIQEMIAKHAEKIDFFLIGKTILEIIIFFFVTNILANFGIDTKAILATAGVLGIAYKTNVTHVMRVLNEIGKELKETPEYGKYILSDIEVYGLNEFQDSAIVIQFRIKTTPQEQWMIKRRFNQMVKEAFDRKNIGIPFPQVVVNKAEEQV